MNIRPYNTPRLLSIGEVIFIVGLACIPLFLTFPYRVNIFLSWEGAYRISNGELPFRDFGTPLGGMYWVVPGIFFKLLGSQMITLIKAQVFINIISGLAFRSLLKSCNVEPAVRFVSILLYCLSFSFFNFWPWYNHSVIVYELIGLAFLFRGMNEISAKRSLLWYLLAAFFTVCSFLTKQDAGAMGFFLSCGLLTYHLLNTKNWRPLVIYIVIFLVCLSLFILPFINSGFGYWFNHGQAPHSSRVSVTDIVEEFMSRSDWIKFYLLLMAILLISQYKSWHQLWSDRRLMLFLILTTGILGQAVVFAVTSYTPPDNNIFFHSFAFAFILTSLFKSLNLQVNSAKIVGVLSLGLLLWWSNVYWKYIDRIFDRVVTAKTQKVSVSTEENLVNKETYLIKQPDTIEVPVSQWGFVGLKSFERIYMPKPTIDGIHRLLKLEVLKKKNGLKVLNMSELTPLAAEIPFKLESGSHYPLWYHLGVGMFNKQAQMFEDRIASGEYDLVLFEHLPTLNNFYPFRVREALQRYYLQIDSFTAPRRGASQGIIEVYVRK